MSADLMFKPLLEVCVDGVVAETIDNVGLKQQFTGVPNSMTHALIITATPSCTYAIQQLELLAVVKVFKEDRLLGRVTARFTPAQHASGPYDVFKDDVIMLSKPEDTVYAMSHYTRQWPRMWTHMTMEINMYALSLLFTP